MDVYLYGLQRSGTNILEAYIKDNYRVNIKINQKHLRIQHREWIKTLNNLQKEGSKFILIYKNIYSWLVSIERWAGKEGWEKKDKMDYIDDYIGFMNKWISMETKNLLFISYEEFMEGYKSRDSELNKKLSKFLKRPTVGLRKRKEVICSGRWYREKYYQEKKYMLKYTKEDRKIIDKKLKLLKKIRNLYKDEIDEIV